MVKLLIVALEDEFKSTQLSNDWVAVYTGVGKVNASINTIKAIYKFNPSLVVNYGTVGSVRDDITGLHEISKFCQRDMDARPKIDRGITPFSDEEFYLDNNRPGLRCGTGDNFVSDRDDWLINHCDVVDMEGYSVVKSAQCCNIPWRSFKYITDFTNKDGFDHWQENVSNGQDAFLQLLKTL